MVIEVKRYFFTEDQKAEEKSLVPSDLLKSLFWLLVENLEFLFAIINALCNEDDAWICKSSIKIELLI